MPGERRMRVLLYGPEDQVRTEEMSPPFSAYLVVPGETPDSFLHYKLTHTHTAEGVEAVAYRFDHRQELPGGTPTP
jgi:hypothetical protein